MARQQVASDNFNRPDETLGAPNWQQIVPGTGDVVVVSNKARGTNAYGNHISAGWISNSFRDDQYAEVTVDATGIGYGNNTIGGVGCRWNGVNSPNHSMYEAIWINAAPTAELRINKMINATLTTIASTAYSPNAPFTLALECEGSTLRLLLNGTVVLTATDTELASGSAAIVVRSDSGVPLPTLDDWSAGNIVSVAGDQKTYRYFNDDGDESGSTAMAAQDVNVTVSPGGVFRVRFGIQATGDPVAKRFRLEYDTVGGSDWKRVP
jgi:hypothetical protein